jgi:hypothetical protein
LTLIWLQLNISFNLEVCYSSLFCWENCHLKKDNLFQISAKNKDIDLYGPSVEFAVRTKEKGMNRTNVIFCVIFYFMQTILLQKTIYEIILFGSE